MQTGHSAALTVAFRGFLDEASHERVTGWAWDSDRPGDGIVLMISVDGTPLRRVVANVFRPDLEQAGIGDGRHSFAVEAASLRLPMSGSVSQVQTRLIEVA